VEHPDVAIAKGAVAAWNAGDVDALVACFHADCTVKSYLAQTPEPYRGHDGVRAWERDVREAFGEFDVELQEAIHTGEVVLLIGQVHWQGQASGVVLTQPAGFVIVAEEGLVKSLTAFGSHEKARAAAAAAA
jgi:ketosteroid isomerase-like protein